MKTLVGIGSTNKVHITSVSLWETRKLLRFSFPCLYKVPLISQSSNLFSQKTGTFASSEVGRGSKKSDHILFERATGFAPVTFSLEGRHSTAELRPHGCYVVDFNTKGVDFACCGYFLGFLL